MKRRFSSLWLQHHEKALVFTDQAIVSGSNFLIGILISKSLGLSELGVYTFAWMVLMMCSSLQQSFVSIPMVNEYARKAEGEKQVYLQQLFGLQVILSAVMAFLCYLGISFLHSFSFFKDIQDLVFALPVVVFSYTLYDFLRRIYFLKSKLILVLVLDVIVNWTQVGMLVLHLFHPFLSLTDTVLVFGITYLLVLPVGGFVYFRIRYLFTSLASLSTLHWKQTKWLLASAVLQWFAGNFFIISAGTLLGTEAAGIVRIAQSIVGVLNVFFIALEMYVPVKAALLFGQQGKKELLRYMVKVIVFGLIVCGVFLLVMVGFSGPLLTWIYGIHYAQYSHVLILFAGFYMIVFVGFPLRFALRAMDNTKALFFAYVLSTGFSLLFSAKMVTAWGIWGVLAGLASTQIIMQAWYVKELVGQRTH